MRTGRIGTRAAFAALTARGARARHGVLRVTWLAPEDGSTTTAVAYAIGAPVGTAVVRNRVRRRLRAAVRELALPPGSWLVSAAPAAAAASYQRLRDDLAAAAAKVAVAA